MNTPNNFTPMTLTKNKVRLEINLQDGSGSIALPLADEDLAQFIVTACNEHAALVAAEEAAKKEREELAAKISLLKDALIEKCGWGHPALNQSAYDLDNCPMSDALANLESVRSK